MKNCSDRLLRVSLLTRPSQSAVSTSRWLCRCMNLPSERGRYDFESFRNTESIASLLKTCPPCTTLTLAPKRDDVPLIDPCSGLLSPAARAQLGIRQKNLPMMHAQNLRAKPEKTEQSAMKGSHSSKRPYPQRFVKSVELRKEAPTSVPCKWMDLALRYTYTSTAQRDYDDVDWDSKFFPNLKPPATFPGKNADPLNQRFTLQTYQNKPELWQAFGPQFNKHHLCALDTEKKLSSLSRPNPLFYGRRAPLSRMITTIPPRNPYLLPKASTCPIQQLLQL